MPRYEWTSGRPNDRYSQETMKAIAFADAYLDAETLVAVIHDSPASASDGEWRLTVVEQILGSQ